MARGATEQLQNRTAPARGKAGAVRLQGTNAAPSLALSVNLKVLSRSHRPSKLSKEDRWFQNQPAASTLNFNALVRPVLGRPHREHPPKAKEAGWRCQPCKVAIEIGR